MSMVTVTCQDCGRVIELNDHYLDGMIARGELVRGVERTQRTVKESDSRGNLTGVLGEADHFEDKVFDICKKCKLKPGLPPAHPERVREESIQGKIRTLREMRPDLSLEQAAHAAVDESFDPQYDRTLDPAFRAFLLERQGL